MACQFLTSSTITLTLSRSLKAVPGMIRIVCPSITSLQDGHPDVDCRQSIHLPEGSADCAKLLECEPVLDSVDDPDLNIKSCDSFGNTENGFVDIGSRFLSPEALLQKCREFASSTGYVVDTNGHQFPPSKPHPVYGLGKMWQRGKIYCTYKEHNQHILKSGPYTGKVIRTTCTWFVKFTFDRSSVDYVTTTHPLYKQA